VSYITGEGILQARGSAFAHARPAQAGHAQKPYLAIGKNLAMIAAQCRQTEGGPDVPGNGNEQYLFTTRDILLVLESQKAKLVKRAQEIPGNTLLNASEHDLVHALVEEFRLDVPVLKENERYLAHRGEVQVDVTGDPVCEMGVR
jgi:hypothetical protein